MDNMEYLYDQELSWEAKGMLTYIMNQSAGFVLNKKYFYSNFAGGRRKVESIFKELQDKGYLNMSNGNVQNVQSVVQNVQRLEEETDVHNVHSDVQNVQRDVQNVHLLIGVDNNTPISPKKKKVDEMYEAYKRWYKSDNKLEDAVNDFYQHRKEQGDKITDRSKKMFLKRLQTLSHADVGLATKLVEYAILRNWKTVYQHKFDETPQDFVQKQKNTDRL
jgi:hypothetical protein